MKSIYDFTKILSILFLLSGIGFIFSQLYFLAAIGIGAFLLIRFIDSDFMFNAMQLDNPNAFVVSLTFIVLSVYVFFVYQEMQYAPLLTKVTKENIAEYLKFENAVTTTFNNCSSVHNNLIDKMDYGTDISEKEQKDANKICFNSSSEIEKYQLSENFPKSIKSVALKNKSNFKKAAINLSAYKYSENAVQDSLINRVKTSIADIKKNTFKIRTSMDIDNQENKPVPVSVKF